jgi:AcrR family transcriptional regulator
MLGEPLSDWRAKRRATATADIVDAAWGLAREHGLAGLSLRDLARRLGMAAPSLYSYFDSKHALYDAMFADGWRAFLEFEPPVAEPDLRTAIWVGADRWIRFCLADPVRYQLLSHRPIPGFEPSPESYAVAQEAYEQSFAPLKAVADVTQEDLDLITAVVGGLVSQQIANDPGGTRWVRLLDDVVDLATYRIENAAKKRVKQARRPAKKGGG